MLISFCIPTYNRKEYLEELLNSINNQEKFNLDIEIFISYNASPDVTQEILDVWRNNFNFPILYQRNSVI
ncbi:glycosyltransferase family 2 protein, partial [Salmonella enterica subsp. enterica serovar Typhimurium]